MSRITETVPETQARESEHPPWLEFLRRRPRSLRGGLVAGLLGGFVIAATFCALWCFVQLSGLPLLFVPGLSVACLTGAAVREFSGGTDRRFGCLAAGLALLACLVLDVDLAWGIMARQTGSSPPFSPSLALTLFREHGEAAHLLSYALAASAAYAFALGHPQALSPRMIGRQPWLLPVGLFAFLVLIGGLVLFTLSGRYYNRLSLSPNGHTLVADGSERFFSTDAVCWNLISGQRQWQEEHFHPPPDRARGPEFLLGEGHTGPLRCRILAPASHTVFTAGMTDKWVRGWDSRSGRQTHSFSVPLDWITSLALTSDGRTLAVAGGTFHRCGAIYLIDVQTQEVRRILTVPADTVAAVLFTPDNRTVIAGTMARINAFTWDRHGGVHRWDVASGEELPPLH